MTRPAWALGPLTITAATVLAFAAQRVWAHAVDDGNTGVALGAYAIAVAAALVGVIAAVAVVSAPHDRRR